METNNSLWRCSEICVAITPVAESNSVFFLWIENNYTVFCFLHMIFY